MKINLLHVTFDMHIGGAEQVIRNLVEATDKTVFNASILCIESPVGPIGKILSEEGIQVDSLSRKQGFDIQLIFSIRKYILQNNIDVLHCHQYTPWVYGVFASIFTGAKVVFTEHGRFYPDRTSWKRKFINPFLARMTDHITAISKATKQALIDYEYIPESKIEVIYNGIAEPECDNKTTQLLKEKLAITEDTLVLGTISRLDPIKNHRLLVSAFARIQQKFSNAVLLIVGDGELRSTLEKMVVKLGVADKVIFTGFQTHPLPYLQLMDIFLLPSLSEGTAMTLLEAMSLSKPCIVTDVGGNPEIIEHRLNGLVTRSNDEDMLVGACELLLEDSKLRKELGTEGRKQFDKRFTVQHMQKQYQEIYQ